MARPITDIDAVVGALSEKESYIVEAELRKHAAVDDLSDPWLLMANIFGMHLSPDNVSEPFGPGTLMDGMRSLIPPDLTDEQLATLEKTFQDSKDPEVRARLGDILWVVKKDFNAARQAVCAYMEAGIASEDPDDWPTCMERYTRAARLAMSLGRKSAERADVAAHLLARVRHYGGGDPLYFTEKGIDLLLMLKEGDPKEYAVYAEKAATRARAEEDGFRARTYYELLERLHRQAGDDAAADAAHRAISETWVEEAERRSTNGENMAAHTFMTNAIRAYRGLAGTKEIVAALHKRLNEFGEKSLDEFQEIETQYDFSAPAENARKKVAGLELVDAIYAFAMIAGLSHPDSVRERVMKIAKQSPMQHIMGTTVVDPEGRKVADVPSMMTDDADEQAKALRLRIVAQAVEENRMIAAAAIWPAFQVITEEHFITETEIAPFCLTSGFVPDGREPFFIRGLAAGFRSDFLSALSVLIPQIENSLRYLLKQVGVITTSLDTEGVEEEWPLSRLLANPELEKMMGPVWPLALKSMLTEKQGPNFRNLLLHGVLGPGACQREAGVFVWWLTLRLVVWATPQLADYKARTTKPVEPSGDAS